MADPLTNLNAANPPVADHPTLHGGDLHTASRHYGLAPEEWLDLSTGISPFAYPFATPEASAWQRLPYPDPRLIASAAAYYGHPEMLATAGSQPVIQALPRVLPEAAVLVPDVGYREHAQQWQAAGRTCEAYPALDRQAASEWLDAALARNGHRHLVVINPNNPTGLRFDPAQLARWARCLAPGCHLIIDEAFIDPESAGSVLPQHWCDNMIVLRSFGKFFGLAGLRIGFVAAAPALRERLQQALGPWSVNGPAQAIAIQALADHRWQQQARHSLRHAADCMAALLAPLQDTLARPAVHTPLFSSLPMPYADASALQDHCARQGILLRVIRLDDQHGLLRLGRLDPDSRHDLRRLQRALDGFATRSGRVTAPDMPSAVECRLDEPQTAERVGEVWLVGAGPGDPELLTTRARRMMQQADVVLYDSLVSSPILELLPPQVTRHSVGKRKGHHTMSQEAINDTLLQLAREGNRVLRLKGGDPFIFGRGGEEQEWLVSRGIPVQVVPGITAAAGCASYAGIPLTHRDHVHSVRFVTAHLKDETRALPWAELARPGQTLVFYMGLAQLRTICRELVHHGCPSHTPAALIQEGTTPRQRVWRGTLASLPEQADKDGPLPPTLIIVGEVIALSTSRHPGVAPADPHTRS
ncbi:uroporphyrinogen-III C-methyltransferase [Billgrantia azerbaijanica]|nr:uroporphyrinogen-III C-methyltransferase [Halomonas azerbaijanica]